MGHIRHMALEASRKALQGDEAFCAAKVAIGLLETVAITFSVRTLQLARLLLCAGASLTDG